MEKGCRETLQCESVGGVKSSREKKLGSYVAACRDAVPKSLSLCPLFSFAGERFKRATESIRDSFVSFFFLTFFK